MQNDETTRLLKSIRNWLIIIATTLTSTSALAIFVFWPLITKRINSLPKAPAFISFFWGIILLVFLGTIIAYLTGLKEEKETRCAKKD